MVCQCICQCAVPPHFLFAASYGHPRSTSRALPRVLRLALSSAVTISITFNILLTTHIQILIRLGEIGSALNYRLFKHRPHQASVVKSLTTGIEKVWHWKEPSSRSSPSSQVFRLWWRISLPHIHTIAIMKLHSNWYIQRNWQRRALHKTYITIIHSNYFYNLQHTAATRAVIHIPGQDRCHDRALCDWSHVRKGLKMRP